MSPTTTRRLGIVREARLSRPHPHALAAALKQIKRHKERRPPQLSRNGQWGARTLTQVHQKGFYNGFGPPRTTRGTGLARTGTNTGGRRGTPREQHGSRLSDSCEDGEALSSVHSPALAAGKLIHNLLCDGRVKND